VNEEVIVFGQAARLVGVVTSPRDTAVDAGSCGVILLNAGRIHRVGPNRLHVKLARQLAAKGFTVLRFDFSGMGDSGARTDHLPIDQSRIVETREAMDWLGATRGFQRFILAGLCSGATAAFQTALVDSRVAGAVIMNARGRPTGTRDSLRAYTRKFRRYYWKMLLSNPRSGMKAVRRGMSQDTLGQRWDGWKQRWRERGQARPQANPRRPHRIPLLIGRGVNLLFVYSQADVGLDYFHVGLGDALDGLLSTGHLQIEVIPETDHVFTLLPSQEHLLEVVGRWAERIGDVHAGDHADMLSAG
jgi:pimeloyl-ACP methyl ester carboxylesterase